MAKNLASVKPVKGYGWHHNGRLSGEMRAAPASSLYIPVTLIATARYKKLMDVVKAAYLLERLPYGDDLDEYYGARVALAEAIEAAEKAGAI